MQVTGPPFVDFGDGTSMECLTLLSHKSFMEICQSDTGVKVESIQSSFQNSTLTTLEFVLE
jgi:hypothetical protein